MCHPGITDVAKSNDTIVWTDNTSGVANPAKTKETSSFYEEKNQGMGLFSFLVVLVIISAILAGYIVDKNFFTLLLSYCPGGIYEVAVIAIAFDLDPEFVSFHHIIRLLMILFIVPVILKLINKKGSSNS